MNPIVRYCLEMVACSGVFALLYRTLIADRHSFRTCRRYLLVTTTLALLIPLIELPILPPERSTITTEQVQRLEFKTVITTKCSPPTVRSHSAMVVTH